MTQAVAEILEDPNLPKLVAQFQERLEKERQERARFYELADNVKAEFINGEIIMHSPSTVKHSQVRRRVTTLLHAYVHPRGLGIVLDEKALCTFPRNDYEPDVVFFGTRKAEKVLPAMVQLRVPDFVCEVLSEST